MVKDGEDKHGLQTATLKKFKLRILLSRLNIQFASDNLSVLVKCEEKALSTPS